MTKLEKIAAKLNDEFRDILAAEVKSRFDIEIETNMNILGLQIVSTRLDGEDFTSEQMQFCQIFQDGYSAAMKIVNRENELSPRN